MDFAGTVAELDSKISIPSRWNSFFRNKFEFVLNIKWNGKRVRIIGLLNFQWELVLFGDDLVKTTTSTNSFRNVVYKIVPIILCNASIATHTIGFTFWLPNSFIENIQLLRNCDDERSFCLLDNVAVNVVSNIQLRSECISFVRKKKKKILSAWLYWMIASAKSFDFAPIKLF